jgi:hypothetical protein
MHPPLVIEKHPLCKEVSHGSKCSTAEVNPEITRLNTHPLPAASLSMP